MGDSNGMFVFEIVVDNVNSLVNSPHLILKSVFPDVFCLELRHPNKIPQQYLTQNEPTGQRKVAIKPPMSRTSEQWRKNECVRASSEQSKQSGHSVMFSSSPELLIQNMKKCPLALSLWNENDNLIYVGSASLPWHPIFLDFLQKIYNCELPPPVYIKELSSILQEGTGTMTAEVELQLKLTYVNNKITPITQNPHIKRNGLTDDNPKIKSYSTRIMDARGNCGNCFPYMNHNNASRMNPAFCNNKDNCKQTAWPTNELAERFMSEASNGLGSLSVNVGNKPEGSPGATFDVADIRRPCGRTDCNVARDMRSYFENCVGADKIQLNISDLINTQGHKVCGLGGKTQGFVRHEENITRKESIRDLLARCPYLQKMQQELTNKQSSSSICNKGCDVTGCDTNRYGGQMYCYNIPVEKVYVVYYFTVEYNFNKDPSSKEASQPTSKDSSRPPSSKGPTSKESSSAPSTKVQSSKASSTAPSSKDRTSKDASKASSQKGSSKTPSSEDSSESEDSDRYAKFTYCPPTCPILKLAETASCSKAICGIEKLGTGKDDSVDSKCTSPVCTSKLDIPPSPADSDVVIKFKEIYNPCCVKSCDISERVKEFIASNADRNERRLKCREMEDAQDPCYCDCVCNFKFSSKTTYCAICGGYECIGDDTRDLPPYAKPHPCPVYHKLYDKKYIVTKNPWPEEENKKEVSSAKLSKTGSTKVVEKAVAKANAAKASAPEKEVKVNKEAPVETKKKTKEVKKKVGKFTANSAAAPAQAPVEKKKVDANKYAYPPVPKHMGWNWLAKDVPGLEFRTKWRPGAANKLLVRRYRSLMEGSDTIAKKKRAMLQRKKKIEMKPTLVVTKHETGEFTVQMEVFKKYSKERLLYQYPYDEKPPLIYTVGKTVAEQNKLQRQRDRRARRDSRRKSRLLQSTFRDKCQEICLKAYNQAIGVLPLPNPNSPDCPCATQAQPSISPAIDSCSCSDELTISSSDTDHDEWVIEFTPPMANWDSKAKHPPAMEDDESQYNYLDYKVKLFDRNGNPVPRFFKTHEGKQECSDLGGFWGPGHVWLEINKDGFIGPDERWVPMNFFGPDGMSYSAEDGYFTDNTGLTLKLGVDGYIDKDLKWVWYGPKKKQARNSVASADDSVKKSSPGSHAKGRPNCPPFQPFASDKGDKGQEKCKGVSEKVAKGDKGVEEKSQKADKGANEKGTKVDKGKTGEKKVIVDPTPKQGTSHKKNSADRTHNPVVMNVAVTRDRRRVPRMQRDRKPYVDFKKLSKYREIMAGFETYEDFGTVKPLAKTNRASNTPRKKPSCPTSQGIVKKPGTVSNVTPSLGQTLNKTTSSASSNVTTWRR